LTSPPLPGILTLGNRCSYKALWVNGCGESDRPPWDIYTDRLPPPADTVITTPKAWFFGDLPPWITRARWVPTLPVEELSTQIG